MEQLRLRYQLAASAADLYFEAGFTVAYEDVIAGPMLPECLRLVRSRPVHVVVLVPSRSVITARDSARAATGYADWSVEQLHHGFVRETPRIGLWLDTSDKTAEETVSTIVARAEEARVRGRGG